jgi:hypothetical protein
VEELAISCGDANKRLILHILRARMPLRRGLDQFGHYRAQIVGVATKVRQRATDDPAPPVIKIFI